MRALFLTSDYVPGNWSGIGTAVAGQADALRRLGVGVDVLVPAEHPAGHPSAAGRGPAVHPLDPHRCPVRPQDFDVIHLHSLTLSELAFEMRRRFGLPVVYTAHSLVPAELGDVTGWRGWDRVQVAVMAASDAVIFLSASDRVAAGTRLGPRMAPCRVLPNGVPAPIAGSASTTEEPDAPIVFAGRFAHKKGIDVVAAVVRRLAGVGDLRFVLAGGHGDVAARVAVADLADEVGAPCQVLGWLDRDSLDALFGRAALVLVPSRYEPFGMVALEAMRMGAPVLAAAVGGLSEVVTPSSGGRLVGSFEAADWCRAIVDLMGSPAARGTLRRRGPVHVARHYDSLRLAECLRDAVYRPLVSESGARRHGGAP